MCGQTLKVNIGQYNVCVGSNVAMDWWILNVNTNERDCQRKDHFYTLVLLADIKVKGQNYVCLGNTMNI